MAEVKTIKIDVDTKQAVDAMENLSKATHDVNKSFEEVYGDLQPLTTRMGEAEDRLYELANAGKTTTKEYQDLLKTVGNYRKVQIQTDMAVDAAATTMAQKLGGALGGVTAGFELTQGVMGAFGAESEQVEKALLKVQSAMAIAQGVQGVREAIPAFMALRTAAMTTFAGMTTASKIFMTAGIGVLITGIGLLISNFDKVANVFTGEIERNARYTKSLNTSARAIKDNAKELEDRSTALQRNQSYELAMAAAQGATTAELRKMKVAQADERIELEKDSIARAENIYWLAKQKYQKLVNADADEEIIKKAKENAIEAREVLTKEREDLKAAVIDKQEIIRENNIEIAKEGVAAVKAAKDRSKEQADIDKQELEAKTEVINKLKQAEQDYANSLLTEQEKEKVAVTRKYEELYKEAEKYNLDTKKLKEAETAEKENIDKKYEDARLKIIDEANKKANDLKIQAENEYLDQIANIQEANFQASLSEEQREVQAVNDKYFALQDAAKDNAEQLAVIEEAKTRELGVINDKYRKEEADKEKQKTDTSLKLAKDALSLIADIAEMNAGKDLKRQKKAFQIKKAASLAQATIDGYTSVLSTFASTPGGLAIKTAAAALAGVAAAVQIAKIAKSKYEGGGAASTGGMNVSGGDGGGGGGTVAPQAPSFNVVGNSGMNQLAQIQQQPVQAYVVSGEVTSAQALDRNRVKNATL